MVFYNVVLVLKQKPKAATATLLREAALNVLSSGGVIRRLSNEGILRPYKAFRDSDWKLHTYVRYVNLQIDISDTEAITMVKRFHDHPDVLKHLVTVVERPTGASANPNFFPLDAFTRLEEELAWPPQVSSDVYDQIEMNWKEFSKARWSNYLRS
jgi:hypothetical protein